MLSYCLFLVPGIGYASSYSITGTGYQSTGDGFTTNITTFSGGATQDNVSAASTTVSVQTSDCTGSGFTGPSPARWSGVWEVSANSAGTVYGDVIFHFSAYGAGVSPGLAANYMLLYRLHGSTSGTAWTVTGSATVAGDSVTFSAFTIPYADNDFSLGTINQSAGPLPVTLVNFEAVNSENHVHLNWTTASEINNSYFDVERSTNGADWKSIVRVQGQGTSNVFHSYFTIDSLAGEVPSGIYYYRLKQVDFNNLYQYYWIKAVNFSITPLSLQAYPNPAGNEVNIRWISANANTTLRLVSLTGISMFKESISGTEEMYKQIDLTGYPAGVYFLQMFSDESQCISLRILKTP